MHFSKFGYDYLKTENSECFENLMLVYDGGDIYWITCTDKTLKKIDKYFTNSEVFIMGFSLYRREKYKMQFITNIKYKDILEDLKDNHMQDKLELVFSEREYNKYRSFTIMANTFDEAVLHLTGHLSTLQVNIL